MKITNNKSQTTNNTQIQNNNFKTKACSYIKFFWVLGHLVLLFVCDLWFGIWSFILVGFAADKAIVANVAEEGLRDVKSPVYFPPSFFFIIIILMALLIGGIIALVYFLGTKKKKIKEVPEDTRLPWEIAYAQFDELAGSSLLREGQFKEYYSRLSGIVRYYFENQFKIRAPEMTTEEFLWSLERSGVLTVDQKNTLKEFMNSCDIVKFAKHIPRTEEAEGSFQLARQLVEETKKDQPSGPDNKV